MDPKPPSLGLFEALAQVSQLVRSLRRVVEKDQEQEVLGMAVGVIDGVFSAGREHLSPEDPILTSIRDVMSPENVVAGQEVRVLEVLLVAEQLETRLETIRASMVEPFSITLEPGPFDDWNL
jgi:hypothetical protein